MSSPLWKYFYRGGGQNTSHFKAYCLGCISAQRPDDVPFETKWPYGLDVDRNQSKQWFIDVCTSIGSVRGDPGKKGPMVLHLLGGPRTGDPCQHASKSARAAARTVRGDKDPKSSSEDEGEERPSKRKRTAVQQKVEINFKQGMLQKIKGVDVPFSDSQAKAIEEQCARATVSANLPFRWIEDPEVMRLFLMMRTRALDVLPSSKVVGGRLLNEEGERAEDNLRTVFRGKNVTLGTDGWKCGLKNAIAGVNLTTGGHSHLVKLSNVNKLGKDGQTMCTCFLAMIDNAELEYNCRVSLFLTDNDGGSHSGRDAVAEVRPWVFVCPCIGHQGQLISGDYFKVSPEAADAGEKATEIVGWLHNHARIRTIFDDAQLVDKPKDSNAQPLHYLTGNQTRWTTHTIAFQRLLVLKDVLRRTVILQKDAIISAQVGAEKKKKKRAELEKSARSLIQTIDDGALWEQLAVTVEDLEPITYLTNINQADDTRPDQVVLSLAGVFRHFSQHSKAHIRTGMTKSIEKRWKALDQPLFIFTLVLNPFEMLSRFGDKAGIDVFVLNSELLELYSRYHSRPSPELLTTAEEALWNAALDNRKKNVSTAFFNYLGDRGPFSTWASQREVYRKSQGDGDPSFVWQQFTGKEETKDLAEFAIVLLGLCCNQGGNERTFSALRVAQTRLRNRLGLHKLEKIVKIGDKIRREHERDALKTTRDARHVHNDERVKTLLSVPRYADVLAEDDAGEEDDITGTHKVALIKSGAAWRAQVEKWKSEANDADESDSDDELSLSPALRRSVFFPRSLNLLFGGRAQRPAQSSSAQPERARRIVTEEALMMELLQAEYEGEEPDDGELEGSGDDYEG